MSYPYSDEDSTDSDSGIRFKTANTRHHINKSTYDNRNRSEEYHKRRNRSKSRSRSRERHNKRESNRRTRHRTRTPEKYDKHNRRHSSTTSKSEKHNKAQQKSANNVDVIIKIKETPSKNKHKEETPSTSSSSQQDDSFMGPALPPSMKKATTSNKHEQNKSELEKDEVDDVYGPTLPPIIRKSERQTVIGPTLPPHLRATLTQAPPPEIISQSQSNSSVDNDNDDDDDDIVGPLPAGQTTNNPNIMKLEERALEMKLNGLNKVESDGKVREEWMLELPEVHTANLGLGPRQFRAKGVPDMSDRSSWTDTPQDKLNKASNKHKSPKSDIKKEAELEHVKRRDLEQQKIVEKHKKKKKRDKSLLDIHQEKINKKKKEQSSEPEVRRPFSRDIDLKANRFDEAQKKSILKKAQLLDNRFSSGESKFL